MTSKDKQWLIDHFFEYQGSGLWFLVNYFGLCINIKDTETAYDIEAWYNNEYETVSASIHCDAIDIEQAVDMAFSAMLNNASTLITDLNNTKHALSSRVDAVALSDGVGETLVQDMEANNASDIV